MTSSYKRLAAAVSALVLSTAPLHAQTWSWWNWFGGSSGGSTGGSTGGTTPTPTAVPEIDASAGLLAVAAVLAVMALVWERRRRAA